MDASMQEAPDTAPTPPTTPAPAVDTRRGFYWASELDNLPPPRWLVHEVIPEHGLVLLYGESSSGKSTLAVDIGMRVAAGGDLNGRKCAPGLVVHIAGEGVEGLRLCVRVHQKAHDLADVPYVIVHRRIDLVSDDDVKWIADLIAQLTTECEMEAALVIVDTLARCAVINENATDEMGAAIRACDLLKQKTGATVMLVHHTGKDPRKGARGSSVLRAAVDTEIEVRGTSGLRDVSITKQRDGTADVSWQFELRPVELGRDPESGDVLAACCIEHRQPPTDRARRRQETSSREGQPIGKIQRLMLKILQVQLTDGVVAVPTRDVVRIARQNHGVQRDASVYDAIRTLVKRGDICESARGVTLASPRDVLPTGPSPSQEGQLQ